MLQGQMVDVRDARYPYSISSDEVLPDYPTNKHDEISSASPKVQEKTLDSLLSVFAGKLSPRQVKCIYNIAGNDFDVGMECILEGPTLDNLLTLHSKQYHGVSWAKVYVDSYDVWADLVSYYKSPSTAIDRPIRIVLDNQPAIDTGGVRRQCYSQVYHDFAENKHMHMFEGPPCHSRPVFSAEARSSGLYKVLGTMIAHSITQDGVGFPYLSPLCYWYIAQGEEHAIQHVTLTDVGADIGSVIIQVCMLLM